MITFQRTQIHQNCAYMWDNLQVRTLCWTINYWRRDSSFIIVSVGNWRLHVFIFKLAYLVHQYVSCCRFLVSVTQMKEWWDCGDNLALSSSKSMWHVWLWCTWELQCVILSKCVMCWISHEVLLRWGKTLMGHGICLLLYGCCEVRNIKDAISQMLFKCVDLICTFNLQNTCLNYISPWF